MKTVFLADAHLKGAGDPHQGAVAGFLDGLGGIDTLVILGDFFEFWAGTNAVVLEQYGPVLQALQRLRDRGIKLVYLEGNHDFSMGSFFTTTLGAAVYAGTFVTEIGGRRVYMAHGDAVAMSFGYRLWRWILRSAFCRLFTRAVGSRWSWAIGIWMSQGSRRYSVKGGAIEARLREFAQAKLGAGFNTVILAHSHSAGARRLGNGVYANPGSTRDRMSRLVCEDGLFRIERDES